MLAYIKAKIALPNRFTGMIQCSEQIMIRFIPDDIDAFAVNGRGGGSKAVVGMARERRQRKVALPKNSSLFGIDAEHRKAARFVPRASDEHSFTPKHRRRMAAARQFNFPVEIGIAYLDGDVFGLADTGAVWSAKTCPFLSEVFAGEPEQQKDRKDDERSSGRPRTQVGY